MAIGATGRFLREAEAVVLAVIAVKICLYGDMGDAVTLHHRVIGMTLQADLGVKFPVSRGACFAKWLDFMEIMAVIAGSGIRVSVQNRFAVKGG